MQLDQALTEVVSMMQRYEASTIITIPPWSCPAEVFAGLREALSQFPVHQLELPGFGQRLEDVPESWTLSWACEEIVRIAARISGDRLVLVGGSMGGMIALRCAARKLPRLQAVVAIGAAARFTLDADYPLGVPKETAREVVAAGRSDYAGFIEQACTALYFNDDDRAAAARATEFAVNAARSVRSPQYAMDILERAYESDIREDLSGIELPVLLLHGERDLIAPPAVGEFLRDRLADARLEVVPGAGHLPFMTEPGMTAERIRTFLRTLDLSPIT